MITTATLVSLSRRRLRQLRTDAHSHSDAEAISPTTALPSTSAACARRQTALCSRLERALVRAVVETPDARRLVTRCDDVFTVGGHAHREHVTVVPLERAHLRAFGESSYSRAPSRQPSKRRSQRNRRRASRESRRVERNRERERRDRQAAND
eukprot:6212581-Pleurochrysis_carterae.AAC.8